MIVTRVNFWKIKKNVKTFFWQQESLMHRTCSRTSPCNFWVGFWKDDYRVRSIWITWRHVGHTGIPRIPNVLAFVMGSGVTNITMVANIINIRAGKKKWKFACLEFQFRRWIRSELQVRNRYTTTSEEVNVLRKYPSNVSWVGYSNLNCIDVINVQTTGLLGLWN